MRKRIKVIVFAVLVAVMLSACTLRVCTPTYVDAITGQQYYSCVSKQVGPAQPIITVINPYRQMTRR